MRHCADDRAVGAQIKPAHNQKNIEHAGAHPAYLILDEHTFVEDRRPALRIKGRLESGGRLLEASLCYREASFYPGFRVFGAADQIRRRLGSSVLHQVHDRRRTRLGRQHGRLTGDSAWFLMARRRREGGGAPLRADVTSSGRPQALHRPQSRKAEVLRTVRRLPARRERSAEGRLRLSLCCRDAASRCAPRCRACHA
jgi:hypothetical protein